MKYFWAGNREQENSALYFRLKLNKNCDTLMVSAVDAFQVFIDGKLVSYGPDRAPAGYSRVKTISVMGANNIEICVVAYNVDTYSCDRQLPFFGAEVYSGIKLVYTSADFSCYQKDEREAKMPRYSCQRGFAEGYDYTKLGEQEMSCYEVEAPILLDKRVDVADYHREEFIFRHDGVFSGFEQSKKPWWENGRCPTPSNYFNVEEEILERSKGWYFCDYMLLTERTGFIELEVETKEETQIYAVFEEYLPDDKWFFRRSNCSDFVAFKVRQGRKTVLSFEPYALKHLKIICSNKDAVIKPYLRSFENAHAGKVSLSGDTKFVKVFNAAHNTFCQNAIDIFMDCPGRERAGWLCDSYFTAKAERLFTGSNEIEKAFLENFLLAETPEIEQGVVPMCFPAEHSNGEFIPNWAMWFAIEICDYYKRTKDSAFVQKAKNKVYEIVDYFKQFLNEYGLLENLRSWVFLEWSIANNSEYTKGVNFPSNMLYAYMLQEVGILYADNDLKSQASKVQETIMSRSFNGEFFVDNEIRVDGELKRCESHISETCQYYALFTGLSPSKEYEKKIINDFGPLRKEQYPEIGRSNMFIGNYLRFFWLCEVGEYDKVIEECLEYFSKMAEKTGTLWENDKATCSCNHGFASCAAPLLLRCVVGYDGVDNGKVVLRKDFAKRDYQVEARFDY